MNPEPEDLELLDGARARVSGPAHAQLLEVVDAAGRVVFRYEAALGRGRLVLGEGSLEVSVGEAGAELSTRGSLRLAAGGTLHLEGAEGITLRGARLDATLGEASLDCSAASVRGGALRTTWSRIESTAGRLVERLREAHRRVDGLASLRAARVRTQVSGDHHLQAATTRIEAEGDVRIHGATVHLG